MWTFSGRPICGSKRACWRNPSGRTRGRPVAAICTLGMSPVTSACSSSWTRPRPRRSFRSLQLSANVGIWNHAMGFFGFPGETRDEAWSSVKFLEENKDLVHSVGFGTFDLSKHTPVAKHPEKWGVTPYKNPEWDLALDYYYTVKEGLSVEEAEQVFEEFERNHYPGWDLKIFIREYVFLYVAKFGTNRLPALQFTAFRAGFSEPSSQSSVEANVC